MINVLLIEDSAVFVMGLKLALSAQAYSVEAVGTPALRYIGTTPLPMVLV